MEDRILKASAAVHKLKLEFAIDSSNFPQMDQSGIELKTPEYGTKAWPSLRIQQPHAALKSLACIEHAGRSIMPEKATMERAKKDLREGKSPSTAAGEFVREEIEHVREGKHGARSPQQAIAIGLSKARRAGVPLKPPAPGKTSAETRQKAKHDVEKGRTDPKTDEEGSTARGRSRMKTMQREPKNTTSHKALSEHAKKAASRRKKEN